MVLGLFFYIILVLALAVKIAKKMDVAYIFFLFFRLMSTKKHRGHNIDIYFQHLCILHVFSQKNAQFCPVLVSLHFGP